MPPYVVRATCDFAGCTFTATARTTAEAQAAYAAHVKAVHLSEIRLAARGSDADAVRLTSPNLREARAVLKRRP